MEKPLKRTRDENSDLPTAIVNQIFSFLPTVNAVRTTILSKEWDQVWTKYENLDFDSERDFRDVDGFVALVSSVLYLRDSVDIRKFRLNIVFPKHLPCIDDWICTAVWRNVVELDLRVNFGQWEGYFYYPERIFRCKTLQVLKLNLYYCQITCDPPTSGSFPSLKLLHVSVKKPEDEAMQKLFSCCPVLECLIIEGSMSTYSSFKISAPKLKMLIISLECTWKKFDISVDAPELEKLYLNWPGVTEGGAKPLVKANIPFSHLEIEGQLDLSKFPTKLLDQVSDFKSVYLSADCLEILRLPDDRHLPFLRNVSQLKLAICGHCCWKLLAVFLDSAHSLEDLVLEYRAQCHAKVAETQWIPPRDVPVCFSSNLKTISFKGFKGLPAEIEIIRYLLQNGQLLEKMTVSPHIRLSYLNQEELYAQFMTFPRATACYFEFMQMQV
ncbi:F-box/LRR-repeat protein 13-like [Argentina anserina]|uniref:F-box/LRR-repeat protein 13-like n=1 Tax=Argentina anserina TaxID=57926 RepID=UPI0021765BB3|nr:F-box/LRR-repeat protein 13-like [Potentilla anserina]